MQAIYRVRQGLGNLTARVGPEDATLAQRYLSPAELRLFDRLEATDRRHSIGVLKSLLRSGVQDRAILKAALLHDVGKSRCHISIFHRTAAVILRALFGQPPESLNWLGREPFWRPFYVLENHARLSAAMLAKAGCEERVWRLAELHHADLRVLSTVPDEDWLRDALAVLRQADCEN